MQKTRFRPSRPRLRRFTVDEYYDLARAGILRPDERVELIEGRIVSMSPIGIRHAECVRRITDVFYAKVRPYAKISVKNPIRLSDRSEPGPDLALMAKEDLFTTRHPRPEDVLLLVEVSDTTLAFDRNVKLPLYARAGIPEVWIVSLEEDRVYVFRRPERRGYAVAEAYERGGAIAVGALPEAGAFRVDDLLVPAAG